MRKSLLSAPSKVRLLARAAVVVIVSASTVAMAMRVQTASPEAQVDFRIPSDPQRVVLSYEVLAPALQPPPSLTLRSDGTLETTSPKGRSSRVLPYEEITALLTELWRYGLFDIDYLSLPGPQQGLKDAQGKPVIFMIDDAPLVRIELAADVRSDDEGAFSRRHRTIEWRNNQTILSESPAEWKDLQAAVEYLEALWLGERDRSGNDPVRVDR